MSRHRLARGAFDASVSARERRLARQRGRDDARRGALFKPSRRALGTDPDDAPAPNLLSVEPRLTLDAGAIVGALDFAFAGGGCAELLTDATARAALPDSDFEPDCFADDLFVHELIRSTMQLDIDGWRPTGQPAFIERVLCSPPSERAVVEFRREILAELRDEPPLRRALEQLYRSLSELWQLLGEPASSSRYEATRRRIDVLALLRGIIDTCRARFGRARSGLSRVADFAERVASTEAFSQLLEVLEYENDMARVDVRMQVGVDGRVRRFQILRLSESDDNSFYATPLGRWVGKLVLFWRGFRFSDDELVDRWLDQVFESISPHLPSLVMIGSHAEVYLATLALRDRAAAKGLAMCLPELDAPGGAGRRLTGLFNPLLFAQDIVPRPCDVTCAPGETITILTGPNSGGKTRLLQALGLAQLLGQGGFFAPFAAGTLPVATGLFVSVIAEHSAVDREGRLGTELMRIRRLFERARDGALVILDELCSGTNPSEGEEIFLLVLQLLAELGPDAFISTHFLTFARRLADESCSDGKSPEGANPAVARGGEAGELAGSTARETALSAAPAPPRRLHPLPLAFWQVELDPEQRPTYAFVRGVASTSLAAQTAARLGVTREELMALVGRNRRKPLPPGRP